MTSMPPPSRDVRRARTLLWLFQNAVVLVFAGLLVAFGHVQIGQHERFLAIAENNHQRTLSLRAPRGAVLDRDGGVLVENRHSLNVSLVRDQVEDLEGWIERLARVTGADETAIAGAVERNNHDPSGRPIVVIRDASLAQVAAVAARRRELPGLVVEQVPTRHYPTATFAAHTLGYVGEVTDAQLSLPRFEGLRSGAIVGHAGIEYAYNARLMGTDGERHVIVNSLGREIEAIREIVPVQGEQLQLTIDSDLQRAAEEAFEAAGFDGSAAVMDPRSGEVLALVSRPAYDPNAFAAGIDAAAWTALTGDPLKPLQNRALRGRYSPGSTFKVVMAVAGLEEGVVQPEDQVVCRGGRRVLRAVLRLPLDAWKRGSAACPGPVLQYLFLPPGAGVGHRRDPQVGHGSRSRQVDRHRPAVRVAGADTVAGVEARDARRALVPGRDHLGRHRTGSGFGDAAVDGGDDLGRRQRRPGLRSPPAARVAR